MVSPSPILVLDAGPLITLAYADRLDALQAPGWPVHIVDMVLHEVTRNHTPTSGAIANFVAEHKLPVTSTEVYKRHQNRVAAARTGPTPRKAGLGESAIQEYMLHLDMEETNVSPVFLFEDHKIAQTNFHLPEQTHRVSTRAFLIFLEEKGWIDSAVDIEHAAIRNGRNFSRLRFPL